MQLHHSLLQLTCLVWREAEVVDVVGAVLLGLVVPQFGLDSVGAQEGVGDKRAGQTAGQDVVPQLQAQVVPEETQEEIGVYVVTKHLEEPQSLLDVDFLAVLGVAPRIEMCRTAGPLL